MLFKQLFDIFKKVYFFKGLCYNESAKKNEIPSEIKKPGKYQQSGLNLLFDLTQNE